MSIMIPADTFRCSGGDHRECLEHLPDRPMGRLISTLLSMLLLGACEVFSAAVAEVTVLHEFARSGTEGYEPQGALLRASDGALYGTTLRGGTHKQGVVFKLSPKTKDYQVLHHFSLERSNGRAPGSPLTEGRDGALYGTTSLGGAVGHGTVFRINKDGKNFTIVHSFSDIGQGGRVPFAGLRQGRDGAWLGTTDEGGLYGTGTIYRLNADGTGHRVLHHFGGKFRGDGEKPRGTLCAGSDDKWYGVTVAGGRNDFGTVFVMNGDGAGYRVLAAFTGAPQDAAQPFGGLIETADGKLYGTSVAGGRAAQGTVFRLGKNGGPEILREFSGLSGDGRNPYGELVEGKGGTLYGVTLNGGAQSGGLVFQMARDGSGCKTLFTFSEPGAEGRGPYAGLTLDKDGNLYGTTSSGGPERAGSVFRIRPAP